MSTLKVKDIKSSLIRKGFKVEKDRKHIYYYLVVDGKRTSIKTFISHGENEIDDFLIGKMKDQTKLETKEFIDLINCPLSKESYVDILIERGSISL